MTLPREVRRPSASALDRAFACEASLVLDTPPEAERAHDAPSKKGDRIHAAIERYQMGARIEDVRHVLLPEDCPIDLVLPTLPKVTPIAGLPFVEVEAWYNPLTTEAILGCSGTPRPPGFWRGRADCDGMYEHPVWGPLPTACDWKSGHPRYQVAASASQLGYHALWLSKILKVDMVASMVFRTRDADVNVYVWDEKRLAAFEKRCHDHEARLCLIESWAAEPTLEKGKHCTFCQSKPVCPLWARKADEDGHA